MTWPNFPFVSQNAPPVLTGDFYAPDGGAFGVSDHFGVSVTSSRIRFTRPTVDGQGFENTTPGARVRFATNSSRIDVLLRYTNLVTRLDTYNGVGAVYADGVRVAIFDHGSGGGGQIVSYDFGSTATRQIEVVFPYCASVDFEGLYVVSGATLAAPAARTATRYLAIGDSITHGFNGTAGHLTWPYLLALSKGWQIHNHGYGGRALTPGDATAAVAGMPALPSVATYLIAFNNFYPQTSLTAFRTNYDAFIAAFRTAAPACKLYCITPTWTPHVPGDGLVPPSPPGPGNLIEDYRQKIRDAVAAAASGFVVLIEGAALATGDVAHFPDGIHPNDACAVQIAASLGPLVIP